MSPSKLALLAVGVGAIGLAVGVTKLAVAAAQHEVVGNLVDHEGILVDVKTFKISRGQAKGDPIARIAKLGAKEVTEGGIIFRVGDKLYIVDGRPLGSTPQAMREMPSTIDGFNDMFGPQYMR